MKHRRYLPLIAAWLCAGVFVSECFAQFNCPDGRCPLPAIAAPQPIHAPFPRVPSAPLESRQASAICRVRNELGRGAAIGSGTLIEKQDDAAVVLSCAHLFREGIGRLEVRFGDGPPQEAQLVDVDWQRDLSALVIAAPSAAPVTLAQAAPRPGDALWSSGYGGDGRLWTNAGSAVGLITVRGGPLGGGIELTGTARGGDSGGPIFNRQGDLAGVIFGTDGRIVAGTHVVECCRFLDGLRGKLAALVPQKRRAPPPALPTAPPASPIVELQPTPPAGNPQEPPIAAAQREQSLQAALDIAQQDVRGKAATIADLQERLAAAQRLAVEIALPTPEPHSGPITPEASDHGSFGGAIGEILSGVSTRWLAGALIGLGVPSGAAGIAAWLAVRTIRRRRRAKATRAAASDTLETPAVERHHNHYVGYETTSRDKAWAHAHAHVGQKYPGAVPYLKIAESVKDQILSGQDP